MPHRLGPMQVLPAPMRRFAENETIDYCIVGVGSAGGVLLQRLARAGLRVVGIEAGPRSTIVVAKEVLKIDRAQARNARGENPPGDDAGATRPSPVDLHDLIVRIYRYMRVDAVIQSVLLPPWYVRYFFPSTGP